MVLIVSDLLARFPAGKQLNMGHWDSSDSFFIRYLVTHPGSCTAKCGKERRAASDAVFFSNPRQAGVSKISQAIVLWFLNRPGDRREPKPKACF